MILVNKYNNTYHNTIKMKSVDVKSGTYVDSSKEINDKDPKFKVGNIVRISKYKNNFEKGSSKLVWRRFCYQKRIKNTVPWRYITDKEIIGTFYKNELQKNKKKIKKNQKEFRVEKVLKRKGDKLCIKWEGYDSFLTVGLIRKT